MVDAKKMADELTKSILKAKEDGQDLVDLMVEGLAYEQEHPGEDDEAKEAQYQKFVGGDKPKGTLFDKAYTPEEVGALLKKDRK